MSKDEASYWRKDNSKTQLTSQYTFHSLPWPIRDDLIEDMLANPIQFESDHPDVTIDEMFQLYESSYLCCKTARRPGAWASEQEDEEEAEAKLEWCPVTACYDMDLLPTQKAKVALHLHFMYRPVVIDFLMFAWTCTCQACHTTHGGGIR
jgi:hypothetical protein